MAKAQNPHGFADVHHTSHNGCKACAMEQLDILEKAGCNPKSICIGHLSDITDDLQAETHKAIAKRGAFLGSIRSATGWRRVMPRRSPSS